MLLCVLRCVCCVVVLCAAYTTGPRSRLSAWARVFSSGPGNPQPPPTPQPPFLPVPPPPPAGQEAAAPGIGSSFGELLIPKQPYIPLQHYKQSSYLDHGAAAATVATRHKQQKPQHEQPVLCHTSSGRAIMATPRQEQVQQVGAVMGQQGRLAAPPPAAAAALAQSNSAVIIE